MPKGASTARARAVLKVNKAKSIQSIYTDILVIMNTD